MASSSSNSSIMGAVAALLAACITAAPTLAAEDLHSGPSREVDAAMASSLLLRHPTPEYPVLARVNYIQGRVRMELLVSRDGRVFRVHVLRGHPFLAVAALRAVRRWIYRPFDSGFGPEPFSTVIDVNFSLQTRKLLDQFPADPEKDLGARVQPPAVLNPPAESHSASHVVVHVLVDSEGHALDSCALSGPTQDFEQAQKLVQGWAFRPAHWGALAVPWYLDVIVPVEHWATPRAAADPGG